MISSLAPPCTLRQRPILPGNAPDARNEYVMRSKKNIGDVAIAPEGPCDERSRISPARPFAPTVLICAWPAPLPVQSAGEPLVTGMSDVVGLFGKLYV